MASNIYTRTTADGKTTTFSRKGTQGRKKMGLAPVEKIQLFSEDDEVLKQKALEFGYYWNRTDFIRQAVHYAILNPKNCSTQ